MDQAWDIFDSKGEGIHVLLLVLFSFVKPTLIKSFEFFNKLLQQFSWIVCDNPQRLWKLCFSRDLV